jgi:hypothetical protein
MTVQEMEALRERAMSFPENSLPYYAGMAEYWRASETSWREMSASILRSAEASADRAADYEAKARIAKETA